MTLTFAQTLDVAVVVFALFLGHFLVIAAGAYYGLWSLGRERLRAHRIQQQPLRDAKPRRELAFSVLSISIFTVLLTAMWALDQLGFTAIYWDVDAYGWGWFAASIAVMALVHDSYY